MASEKYGQASIPLRYNGRSHRSLSLLAVGAQLQVFIRSYPCYPFPPTGTL